MNRIHQTVQTGAIKSGGGNVTLAPVVTYQLGEPQEEWRQALLRGPVAALGLEERLHRAYDKAESGRTVEAADDIQEIADRVGDAGYPVVADDLRLEAAGLLQHQDQAQAHQHMLSVAQRQIDRADPNVDPLLWHLAERAQALPPELAGLLRAINNSVLPPREEVEASRAVLKGRNDEAWWRARLTELACLEEEFELALQLADPLRSSSPDSLDDLLIEVDALAAQEALEGASATEEGWANVLAWAGDTSRSPQERGLVLRRRGTLLAYRDDLEASRDAYLSAARAWAEAPDEQEEAATALFSSTRASFFLGDPSERGEDLAVAANLRGRSQTSASIADRLTLGGLHNLIDGKLRPALLRTLRSWRVSRRSGDLHGLIESFHILSRIWQAIAEEGNDEDDRARALHYSIRAGEHKRVEQLAGQGNFGELSPLLRLHGPRWERAASYAAVARSGRDAPEPDYSEIAAQAVAEGEGRPRSGFGNDVVRLARRAAGACVFVEDADVRERAIALMTRASSEGSFDDRERALVALRQAQEAGLADHRNLLLEDYLSDTPSEAVSPYTAKDLFDDETSQERLRQAGLEGRVRALEALVVAGAVRDPELLAVCELAVTSILDLETHAPGRLDWVRLAPEGLFGTVVEADLKTQLAEKLTALATDSTDSRANRMEALGALFTLASALDAAPAADAFDAIAPAAAGDAPPSGWDEEADASRHPLELMRRFEPQRDQHVALAIRAAGALAQKTSRQRELQQLLDTALHESSTVIRSAALEVLTAHSSLEAPERMVQAEEPRMLASQLRLQVTRKGMPNLEDLAEVFASPHLELRVALLQAASAEPKHPEVLEYLTRDSDGYLRAIARRRLAELERV